MPSCCSSVSWRKIWKKHSIRIIVKRNYLSTEQWKQWNNLPQNCFQIGMTCQLSSAEWTPIWEVCRIFLLNLRRYAPASFFSAYIILSSPLYHLCLRAYLGWNICEKKTTEVQYIWKIMRMVMSLLTRDLMGGQKAPLLWFVANNSKNTDNFASSFSVPLWAFTMRILWKN